MECLHCTQCMATVQEVEGKSMQEAVDEVRAILAYSAKGRGLNIMCDYLHVGNMYMCMYLVGTDGCQHDSTSNAYHTTVACLSGR